MAEQEETQPGLECVDRNHEEDPDDPALFCRVGVVSEVLVDLLASHQYCRPGAGSSQTLPCEVKGQSEKMRRAEDLRTDLRLTGERLSSQKCDLW